MQAKSNPILEKTFQFSLDTIAFTHLIEQEKKFAIANQLLKSGTSIGANSREAQSPESLKDFIHKMKIAMKEADETEYWLQLCEHSEFLPKPGTMLTDIKEIQKILNSIITSSKRKLNRF